MSNVEWESQQFCRWRLTLRAEFLKLSYYAYLLHEMHSLANHIGESFLKASIGPSLFGSNTSFILLLGDCLYGHANMSVGVWANDSAPRFCSSKQANGQPSFKDVSQELWCKNSERLLSGQMAATFYRDLECL